MSTETGLLKPFWFGPIRHLWRLLSDPGYRQSAWLHSRFGYQKRFKPLRLYTSKLDIKAPDAASFLSAWDDIFARELYRFDFDGDPRILDLGANIGLASLYFKRRFPDSKILAVEADPQMYDYLVRNLEANGCEDVDTLQAAAWTEDGTLRFSSDGADGGRLTTNRGIDVPSVDIRRLLQETDYDMLKLDIEGAERTIIPAIADTLATVSYIFVEYHGERYEPQNLDSIISALTHAGFRILIETLYKTRHPLQSDGNRPFEQQLNIFGRKT